MSRGFTVALIGADGAGKTTVAREVAATLPVPVTYLYMGVSQASANHVLPVTRLVRWVRRRRGTLVSGPATSVPALSGGDVEPVSMKSQVRSAARLANRMSEEAYRQVLATIAVRRGRVVIFDRHFYADYYASDVAGKPESRARRIHGWFLKKVLPRPDIIVHLDAPAEVLFARKGEGTVEILEELSRGYRSMSGTVRVFETVDVSRPLEIVIEDVNRIIMKELLPSPLEELHNGTGAG
jgi:thymidylate kinase